MLKFEKYQGAGNDFVIFNEKELIDKGIPEYSELAISVCNRHYGIGADGMIILKYVAEYPFMLFYNADGSQAPMCGNGIRCFAHYLRNNKLKTENIYQVKTVPGDLTIEIINNEEKDFSKMEEEEILAKANEVEENDDNPLLVKVNMGQPIFDVKKLINITTDKYLKGKINIDGQEIEISYIFMGTDHSVIFVEDFNDYDIDVVGPKIENYLDIFPKKVNVNFVKVYDKEHMEVITWERGAGRTLACGTGATAAAVLARTFGYVDEKVNVKVPGGQLIIEYSGNTEDTQSDNTENNAFMTGPSEKIAEGYYKYKR